MTAKSLEDIKQDLEKNPHNMWTRKELARIFFKQDQFYESIYELNQVLLVAPNDDFVHSFLARCFERLGQLKEAINHAERAIQINPKNNFAFGTLAEISLKQNQPEKAAVYYEAALPHAANKAFICERLAHIYTRQNRPEKAVEVVRQALLSEPENAEMQALQTKLSGNAAPSTPSNPAMLDMKNLREQINRLSPVEAAVRLKKLLRLPDYAKTADLYAMLGHQQKKMMQYREAAESFKKAMELEPGKDFFTKQYGFVLLKLPEQFVEVVRLFEPLVAKSQDDPYLIGGLAEAYLKTNQVDKAQQILIKGVRQFAQNDYLRRLLMKCRAQ